MIVELNVDDFEVGDPLVGQNVVAFDKAGEQIWRIEPTGRTRPRQDGSRAPEAFFNLYHNWERGIVTLTTPDGWRWDLDVNTGERSKPRFVK